ncbi:hypothetical protein EZV62_026060 [Acer yangbiense]|uniref:Protein kinase domain-containing protein n=1 Tax=Acer yangbiense TaxID=1000413 RepID=A0A5C7GRA6_9ROSI|nr:hypothetical protein EZV62_026059 [Acer yangbiense]TXG46766.1 hypothetical protein EZV62_026060 [Acer yangbiense]
MEKETENLVSKNGYKMKKEARNIVVFGKYKMGRISGQGTFTKVYYRKNLATQESVAVKSDIWSCGVVLLSGYLLFQHENVMKMYMKIFKAEFVFPPWISMDAKKLISRVLIAEDDKRITVSGIMKNPRFQKGFGREFSRVIGGEKVVEKNGEVDLFKSKRKSSSMFTSKFAASDIIGKLWSEFCRKGKLAVTAEVALVVTVVELSKSAGDSVDQYRESCEEDVRPALKDSLEFAR